MYIKNYMIQREEKLPSYNLYISIRKKLIKIFVKNIFPKTYFVLFQI